MGRAVALWRTKHGAKHAPTTQMSALRNIRMRSGGVAQRYCYCPRHYDNGIFVKIHTELLTIQILYFRCLNNFDRSPIVRGKRMFFWTFYISQGIFLGLTIVGKFLPFSFANFGEMTNSPLVKAIIIFHWVQRIMLYGSWFFSNLDGHFVFGYSDYAFARLRILFSIVQCNVFCKEHIIAWLRCRMWRRRAGSGCGALQCHLSCNWDNTVVKSE